MNESNNAPVHTQVTTQWPLWLSGLALAACLIWLAARPSHSNLQTLMDERIGDRVYRVIQQDSTVGYLHTSTATDAQGNWVMTQRLNINMLNAPPYRSVQEQVFAKIPPHKLLSATLDEKREYQQQVVSMAPAETGYIITIKRDANTEIIKRSWDYSLADQLHLEQRLARGADLGEEVAERYLDMPKLRIGERRHRIVANSDRGYTLQSVDDASTTQLDDRLRLVSFQAPHQFRFELAQTNLEHLQQYLFADTVEWASQRAVAPLTQDLEPAQQLTALTLTLQALGDSNLKALGLPQTLSATHLPRATDAVAQDYLSGSLGLPVDHPKITALLEQQPINPLTSIKALNEQLIGLTRDQLTYAEHQPAGTVLRALAKGYGECVDFADLLTTVARSQRIPTRTVYGIAYSALPTPGFRFHAWNEILYDGYWHGLDPTWDQVVADATHIPLDDQTMAALASAMQRQAIALTPTQTAY